MPEEVTNDDLCALILAWCKDAHPDFYTKTLKVAANPVAFRKYLLRLVEVRATEDKKWRNSECPIRVLDETSLAITFRQQDTVMVFKGKLATPPIDHRLNELACDPEAFYQLQQLKNVLDLTYT